ncbi:hypothetical protein HZC27_00870 [Candidatus Roizmanbacteria bacterium]|nr:hypothetical protein [Candidatus Roizmanbacteria bacterium]
MFSLRHNLEMFFIITLGTALSLFVLVQRNNYRNQTSFSLSAIAPTVVIATPTGATYLLQTSSMGSPDGSMNLTMNSQRGKDVTKYTFFTSTPEGLDQNIFAKQLDESGSLSIPYNTWSPDNKYVFLKEVTSSLPNYYVLKADGTPLKEGAKYVNIQELFSSKQLDYTIVEVTGWADPNLIIVNAKSNKENRVVSFWFEVSSQSFIALSTYFN